MPVIRAGEPNDSHAILAIQSACPESAHWTFSDYLAYDFRVAVVDSQPVGFLASRRVAMGEFEILDLAVAPPFRRTGIARCLLGDLLQKEKGHFYLEVRQSNGAARNLYNSMGFKEVNVRPNYYTTPPEAAIVMKFHSC